MTQSVRKFFLLLSIASAAFAALVYSKVAGWSHTDLANDLYYWLGGMFVGCVLWKK